MKNLKKIILFSVILFAGLIFNATTSNAATKTANDEQSLTTALSEAVTGDTVEITQNISLKTPLGITDKNITINGKGNTITKDPEWENVGSNGTFISVGANAKVTLSNITLKDSAKYGVQAYNGGYVILDNVTINNCGFGAVLVNAGTVEVRNLTLGRNGSPNNNGIEIAKGSGTDAANVPTVIMNGKLTSSEEENVVYVAENNPSLEEFEVENAEGTDDKIFVSGNTVVITDKEGKILYTSNEIGEINVEGDKYTEPKEEEPKKETPKKEEPKKDETPKTGVEDNLVLSVLIMSALVAAVVVIAKKDN